MLPQLFLHTWVLKRVISWHRIPSASPSAERKILFNLISRFSFSHSASSTMSRPTGGVANDVTRFLSSGVGTSSPSATSPMFSAASQADWAAKRLVWVPSEKHGFEVSCHGNTPTPQPVLFTWNIKFNPRASSGPWLTVSFIASPPQVLKHARRCDSKPSFQGSEPFYLFTTCLNILSFHCLKFNRLVNYLPQVCSLDLQVCQTGDVKKHRVCVCFCLYGRSSLIPVTML